MKMSKSRICKAFNNTIVILLALFVALLFASCSPSSLTLCRVGIDNDKDSRTLSAVIDPLGSNIYYTKEAANTIPATFPLLTIDSLEKESL